MKPVGDLVMNLWLIAIALLMMYCTYMDWSQARPTGLVVALLAFFTLGCIIVECVKRIRNIK